MTTQKLEKTCAKFVCEICNFKCSTITDWNRHIVRPKHVKTTGVTTEKSAITTYECDNCKKLFNDRAGHWRHKKICNFKEESIILNEKLEINNI
jgi:hypothetical protein